LAPSPAGLLTSDVSHRAPRPHDPRALDHEQFVTHVADVAQIGFDQAERATRATLQTLADRISRGEAEDVAQQLPTELGPWIATTGEARRLDYDEFLRLVREREGLGDDVDLETVEQHVRAVFSALGMTVDRRELNDVAAQLPSEFARLQPAGPFIGEMPGEVFLRHVADRAATDEQGARRATEAVLETLGERISGGEVDDLIARLAPELHEPLRRGKATTGGKATRMSLDDFVRRVAEREGIDEETARDHARAVILTMREAIGDDEFFDVTSELPADYMTALAR
jgi:uncharacterized protein (DUF2267 family)